MTAAILASLLPNGEQQFLDGNGTPLVGGSVYFYEPGTSTPQDTWQDPYQNVLNDNPVTLDGAGRAVIYGFGQYRQVVYDADGNLVWDQLTQDIISLIEGIGIIFCGTSGGSANAQTLTPAVPITSYVSGQIYSFFAGFTNTSNALNINISGVGNKAVYVGANAAPAGAVQVNQAFLVQYDGTHLQLLNPVNGPWTEVTQGSNAAVALANNKTMYVASAAITLTLAVSTSLSKSWGVYIFAEGGAVTLTPNAADAINGGSTGVSATIPEGSVSLVSTDAAGNIYATGTGGSTTNAAPVVRSRANLFVTRTSTTALTITADELILEDGSGNTHKASSVNATINTGSSGANGLDTGSIASSTGYFGYIIFNPTTNTVAGLLSLSATAPTMPSGYTYKARVTGLFTDGSSHIIDYNQADTFAQYVTPITMYSGSPSATPISVTGVVPTTAGRIRIATSNNSADFGAGANSSNAQVIYFENQTGSGAAAGIYADLLLESTNIYADGGAAGDVFCLGWVDKL